MKDSVVKWEDPELGLRKRDTIVIGLAEVIGVSMWPRAGVHISCVALLPCPLLPCECPPTLPSMMDMAVLMAACYRSGR